MSDYHKGNWTDTDTPKEKNFIHLILFIYYIDTDNLGLKIHSSYEA